VSGRYGSMPASSVVRSVRNPLAPVFEGKGPELPSWCLWAVAGGPDIEVVVDAVDEDVAKIGRDYVDNGPGRALETQLPSTRPHPLIWRCLGSSPVVRATPFNKLLSSTAS
jgi:hypothetical protein